MLKDIEAVLFDLDGTLVDSMWMWKDIDIIYLQRYGIALPENLQQEIEGMSYTETAVYFKERFAISKSIEEIKQDWHVMACDKYRQEVPLKKGALQFLEMLKSKGIPTGIATSNGRQLVDIVVEALDISPYIDRICTACEVPKGKPSPDIYLKTASDLGVKAERCLVFEDIPMGILAGKRAGMKVCAIEDDFSVKQRLEKRKLADYYISSFEDIFTDTFEVL